VINVVGDVGILFAIFVIVAKVGAIGYADVFAAWRSSRPGELFLVCLGLFIGCAAKSAQVPLHTWLARRDGRPDPGLGADPRGDDGHRRRLSDRALSRRCGTLRPTRAKWSASSAR
jgi:hypothetical protein